MQSRDTVRITNGPKTCKMSAINWYGTQSIAIKRLHLSLGSMVIEPPCLELTDNEGVDMNNLVANVPPNHVRKIRQSACHIWFDHVHCWTQTFAHSFLHSSAVLSHQPRLMSNLWFPPMLTWRWQLRTEALIPSLGQPKMRKVTLWSSSLRMSGSLKRWCLR